MKLLLSILLSAAALVAADEIAGVKITPIQHASVMLEAAGKVIYVDPAQGNYDGRPQADLILLTDIHGDHLAPAILTKLRKSDTIVVAPKAVAEKVTGATVLNNGDKRTFGAFTVEAIPMYNLTRGPEAGKLFHDKGRGNGYILTANGKRFYFSGDTESIPEMRALKNIDVAFVCMNLPYTMTSAEAADAVKAFHPAIVYPYHYRGQDPAVFANALQGTGIEVRQREWYPR